MFKDKVLNELKTFWNDEEAQGMMEYVLIAAAVIALATIVGPRITQFVTGEADNLENGLKGFNESLRQ